MHLSGRVRGNPIRALASIEAVATLLAAAADAGTIVFDPLAAQSSHMYAVTIVVSVICTGALFVIPHSPNRRYAAIGIACVSILALGWLPPHGIVMYVLSAILAARLTFAFDFRGALAAWVLACAALSLSVYADLSSAASMGNPGGAPHGVVAYALQIVPSAILLALLFGIIGLMKIYADNSADAAATGERTRIALDLHDSLGHGLATLRVQLQNAERHRSIDPLKADDYVVRAGASVAELLSDVRETVTLLHDGERERGGPSFTILFDRLCSEFASNHDTLVDRRVEVVHEPSGRAAIALYRTVQEALTNVARHSGARHVWIAVRGDERSVEASVEDDGRGLEESAYARGHGLLWMHERIAGVGGELSISARVAGGTIVRARVPVQVTK